MAFNYKQEYERYRRYYQSIEPALQKPVNRAYTAVIFSFLAVSLFGWYAIRPTMQTIFTLKREIIDKTAVDQKMEEKISALIEAQAAYQDIEADIPLIAAALPEGSDAVRAAAQLQALANDTHVTIIGMSVSPMPLSSGVNANGKTTPPPNKLTSFPLSLTVTGPYTDIKNFLQGILSLRRTMQIDSTSFVPQQALIINATGSAIPSSPTSTYIQLDLKLEVFYLSS